MLVNKLAWTALSAVALFGSVSLVDPAPAAATDTVVALPNTCLPRSVCIRQDGFVVRLARVVTDDEEVTFVYRICPGGPGNNCPAPDKGLSNIRIDLPDACIADVSVHVQTDTRVLSRCEVVDQDKLGGGNVCSVLNPARKLGKVVKCDVAAEDWGKDGEACTFLKVSFPIEYWNDGTINVGIGAVGTKAGPDCFARKIVGPSCAPAPICEPQ